MSAFSHIAAYRFVDLDDLPELRDLLHRRAVQHELMGTILLAREGINLFLCGRPTAVESFVAGLRSDQRFAEIDVKQTSSDVLCYRRLLVKVKLEIITFRQSGVRPQDGRAPAVQPSDLRRWLDAGCDDDGRELVLLDTRNEFEVDAGTFVGAETLGLSKFSDLASAAVSSIERWADKTVVTFCTGGIRCEKAALFLRELGLPRVLQLEGGVLRYFEREQGAHWSGDLFVFDERIELSADLSPAELGAAG